LKKLKIIVDVLIAVLIVKSSTTAYGQTNEDKMTLIYKNGAVEIWQVCETYGFDYYVYGVSSSPRVVPSLDMAQSIAAKG
jgi:hypothetical protein